MSTTINKTIILALLNLVIKYGVSAVIELVKAMTKSEITLEDIQALETKIKKPEEYFE